MAGTGKIANDLARSAAKGARRSGRPAILSKEIIIKAGLKWARLHENSPISISAIARSLNVTPMAIYNYFSSRDDLLQALSASLLEELDIQISKNAATKDAVCAWAYELRRFCLGHPEFLNMIIWEGGKSSAAWLNLTRPLLDAVRRLDLPEGEFGQTMLWLWNSVMSAIRLEIFLHRTEVPPKEFDLKLHPDIRRDVRLAFDSAMGEENLKQCFDFHMEQILRALHYMKERQ